MFSQLGWANSFKNVCDHTQSSHLVMALVAGCGCGQSHGIARGASVTHHMYTSD